MNRIAMKVSISLLVILSFSLKSQNLIPNPSFENIISCPVNMGYPCPFTNLGSFDRVYNWKNPICTSPEIHHTCMGTIPQNFAGYQAARTGSAYAGIYTLNSYSEYICSSLISKLIKDQKYFLKFYVSCGNSINFQITTGSNGIGAFLSKGFPDTLMSGIKSRMNSHAQLINPINNLINDTLNWIQISDTIIANGMEDFITIGNFTPDTLMAGAGAYFYIDDVSIELINPVGLKINLKNEDVYIYPAPFSKYFYISNANRIEGIQINNLLGENIQFNSTINPSENSIKIDLIEPSRNYYIIKLMMTNGSFVTKLLMKSF